MTPFIEYFIESETLADKWSSIKAVIFDWDGVFNSGEKGPNFPSTFSERDSMGINMLRFALWYVHQETMPYAAVVTGANNDIARYFAEREHFHHMVSGALFKRDVLLKLCDVWGIEPDSVLFVYDDILDLSMAEHVGLRIQIGTSNNPAFDRYVNENELVDIRTHHVHPPGAIRFICDQLIEHMGLTSYVISNRSAFTEAYQVYFAKRQSIEPTLIPARELLDSTTSQYL